MSSRSVRPKHLRSVRRQKFARHSATATPALLSENFNETKPETTTPGAAAELSTDSGIDLTNTKKLFSSVSSSKLLKSFLTLTMAAAKPTADIATKVMNSDLMKYPVLRNLFLRVTELSVYDQFCGGKDLINAHKSMMELWEAGISCMLDYGLEHADDNQSCDSNMNMIIRTIDSTKGGLNSPVSFVAVKISAICSPGLLRRVSDLLRWEYKDKSLSLAWKMEALPVLCDSSPFYHTPKRPESLSWDEEEDLELAYDRLFKICKSSWEARLPLLFDAEETCIQPAIDYFTYVAAVEYNDVDEKPLIFNTIQAYLKDARERLMVTKKAADEMGVSLGIKLVRGAYMKSEGILAASLGVDSPIHDNIQNTKDCYDGCAEIMLHNIAADRAASLVLATHNIESGKLAAYKAVNLGIKKQSPCLYFAQLYGMSDALTFGLRNAGFRVSKYLPFGPVDQIMPYLMRRAEENTAVLSASSFDRLLMRKELLRRIMSPGT